MVEIADSNGSGGVYDRRATVVIRIMDAVWLTLLKFGFLGLILLYRAAGLNP